MPLQALSAGQHKESTTMIERLFEQAAEADGKRGSLEAYLRLIRTLAQRPDESLPLMLRSIEAHDDKIQVSIAVNVVREIGYPRNAAAIPLLFAIMSDINHPGSRDTIGIFMDMGPEAAIPHLLQALMRGIPLLDQSSQKERPTWETILWYEDVSGIGVLCDVADPTFAIQCGPVANMLLLRLCFGLHHLKMPTSVMHELLNILARAEEAANYAIPTLIELLKRQPGAFAEKLIWKIINAFSSQIWAPYMPLIDELENKSMD